MEKAEKKVYFYPKTKFGKVSFWIVLVCFVGIYLQYWMAMATESSSPPIFGILLMIGLVICGITSIVSIIKYKDRAISLFLSSLVGILGILFLIGELVFPH